MTLVLIINAEDGRHCHVYPDADAARAGLEKQLGRAPTDLDGPHYDDWGRRMVVEARPIGWTRAKEDRLGDAYDRRECGLPLSKSDAKLLADFEGGV